MRSYVACTTIILAAALSYGAGGGPLAAAAPSDLQRTRDIASEAERLADRFKGDFDDELDKSILNGSESERRLDKRADQLKGKLDDVHDHAKRGNQKKLVKELDRALSLAHDIDRTMLERRFSQRLEDDWRALREHLNMLALEFGLDPLESGVISTSF